MRVYLDNSGTTRVHKEVAVAVYRTLTENFGNPSALHGVGQAAERAMKQARQQLAFLIAANQKSILFTGGGTESDNLALYNGFKNPARMAGRKLLISAIEHPAVREYANWLSTQGVVVEYLPVDVTGLISLNALREALDERTSMLSVMHVNNEIGTIQPIDEIGRIKNDYNIRTGSSVLFHSDAVQSFAKLPIDTETGDFRRVDLLSFSAHKIHGPKGVGALYAARPERLEPMLRGGGQEYGLRSGTENVAGVIGFGVAARQEASDMLSHAKQAGECRQRLIDGILGTIRDARVNGPQEHSPKGEAGFCSPYILSVSFPGVRGEVLVHTLEEKGIYISTGAACSSRKRETERVNPILAAIGLPKEFADGTVRFSFSRYNTLTEMDYVLEHLKLSVERFRR
jgi:cysteine desulfurase